MNGSFVMGSPFTAVVVENFLKGIPGVCLGRHRLPILSYPNLT